MAYAHEGVSEAPVLSSDRGAIPAAANRLADLLLQRAAMVISLELASDLDKKRALAHLLIQSSKDIRGRKSLTLILEDLFDVLTGGEHGQEGREILYQVRNTNPDLWIEVCKVYGVWP